jgi:hypothetical protein
MLGVHAGTVMARLQERGDPIPPPVWLIGKHGTLSGMPKSLWHPLAQIPKGDRGSRVAGYANALSALHDYLTSGRSSPVQR